MPSQSSISDLVDRLNSLYPNLGLNASDFSGYFFKSIPNGGCNSVNKSGSQTDIRITGVDSYMSLFPLITSPQYYTSHNTESKRNYIFACPITLNKINLMARTQDIIDNYSAISAELQLDSMSLKKGETYYQELLQYWGAKNNLFETYGSMEFRVTAGGQLQYQLGHKGNDNDDFIKFREIILPQDYLLVMKKTHKVDYLFFIFSKSDFTGNGFNNLTDIIKPPINESTLIFVKDSKQAQVAEEDEKESRIWSEMLSEEVASYEEGDYSLRLVNDEINLGDLVFYVDETNSKVARVALVVEIEHSESRKNATFHTVRVFDPPANVGYDLCENLLSDHPEYAEARGTDEEGQVNNE